MKIGVVTNQNICQICPCLPFNLFAIKLFFYKNCKDWKKKVDWVYAGLGGVWRQNVIS